MPARRHAGDRSHRLCPRRAAADRGVRSGSVRHIGPDGFGRSDTRAGLRRFFEVDRGHIALAAIEALVRDGHLPADTQSKAIKQFGMGAIQISGSCVGFWNQQICLIFQLIPSSRLPVAAKKQYCLCVFLAPKNAGTLQA